MTDQGRHHTLNSEADFHALVEHLTHVLPGQAPLRDFVHHNTLHGFQHLPFPQALAAAQELTGAYGYLPLEHYREFYKQGRITDADLDAVLRADATLASDTVIIQQADTNLLVTQGDIYRQALIQPLKPISHSQFIWQLEENQLLLQEEARWQACMLVLQQERYLLHVEDLLNPFQDRSAQAWAKQWHNGVLPSAEKIHQLGRDALVQLFNRVGEDLTLRGLLLHLTGEDILHDIRPLLLRQLGAWLDQGMAAWTNAHSGTRLYSAWRKACSYDLTPLLEDLPDWTEHLSSLPDDPMQAIQAELRRMDIPPTHWAKYIERLALELPGWSGMFLWRHLHPGYAQLTTEVHLLDYLAIRLSLEHLFARRLCRRVWLMEADLGNLRGRFRRHPAEFLVRYYVFNERLPEYLLNHAQQLCGRSHTRIYEASQWELLAQQLWVWLHSPVRFNVQGHYHAFDHGWRLFCLAQQLNWDAATLNQLTPAQLSTIFHCLDTLDTQRSGYIWLQAYEHHYRQRVFNALIQNQGRGVWQQRAIRPQAQLVFCMDEREEGIRRHVEELNPSLETLGAAAFFNLPMNWQGLGDKTVTKLCPVPVTPEHLVREVPADKASRRLYRLQQRKQTHQRLLAGLQHITRHSLILGTVSKMLLAPAALGILLGKSYLPLGFGQWVKRLGRQVAQPIPTKLEFIALQANTHRSEQHNQMGFTDSEQADKVGGFLRMIGLSTGFAPLIVIMGHGSTSQNNPHAAAYECGACSGRHSGPNARVFAAMANRPAVRHLLSQQGIVIPEDSWFIGAEHDTCDENLVWYDTYTIPSSLQAAFSVLQNTLDQAATHSAHERCRKLASAPRKPSLKQARQHIAARAFDYSQPRPELGHATNACAFIGRRAMTRGTFLDRRSFLISYDCTQDPDGSLLEGILLSAAPVGAGINLEYYFCTVNNEQYGAGTKITHNLTGLFGVMQGVLSDLRTGLPAQMIEIHEPMRLLVIIEADTSVVTAIYQRQPALQELIGKGWLILAVKNPQVAQIAEFDPRQGFKLWHGPLYALPVVERSKQWYQGHSDHLPPALIAQVAQSELVASEAEVRHVA